jgi:hypothetical protein
VAKVQAMLMARMASRSPLLVLFLRQENKIIVLYGPVLGPSICKNVMSNVAVATK